MKIKKILISSLLLFIIINSIGCVTKAADSVNKSTNATSDNRFIFTGDTYQVGGREQEVWYDRIKKIVYLKQNGNYTEAMCPFIGQDKLPMTLDEYNASK